jgi:tetratricopeptide (TPR) repeat protein
VETIVVGNPAGAASLWLTMPGYWWGALTACVLWLALLYPLTRWASGPGAAAELPIADVRIAIAWPFVGAWLVAGLLGTAHLIRSYVAHYARAARVRRYHYSCARCGYRWVELNLRPDVAQHEARLLERQLAFWRRFRYRPGVAYALIRLAVAHRYAGDWQRAPRLLRECLELLDAGGDGLLRGYALGGLGYAALGERDWPRAEALFEEALERARAAGDWAGMASALAGLATASLCQGDAARARAGFQESLAQKQRLGDRDGIAQNLEGLAGVAAAAEPLHAARLGGAAEALRAAVGVPRPGDLLPCYEQSLEVLRRQLDAARLAAAWDEGRQMPLERVLALAAQP